jgi:prepilin peptidase CpaA
LQAFVSGPTVCLLVFVAAAAVLDLRTRRIPNVLTVAAATLGLLLNVWRAGGAGAVVSATGLLTGLAVFVPFYLAGGFGAGDVKAMAAVGAFLGPSGALIAAAWTLVVGAVGALLVLIALRRRVAQTQGTWSLRSAARERFPYGLAIACGTALSLVGSWRH